MKIYTKTLEYITYFFVALFPFITYKTYLYGGTSTRSVNTILLATIFATIFIISFFKNKQKLPIPKSYIVYSVLIYVCTVIISCIFGESPVTSFWSVSTRTSGVWYLLNLCFIGYIFWTLLYDRIVQSKIILTIILSTSLYSFLALLGPEGLGIFFKGYMSDGFTFGNSTFAAMYIFGSFMLSVYYVAQAEVKKWWMYILPIVLIANPSILSSKIFLGYFSQGIIGEARTSAVAIILSIIGIIVVWGVSKIKNSKIKARVVYSSLVTILVGISIATYSLFSSSGYLRGIYLDHATKARPLVWEMSSKVISERPYFGWGIDTFERVFEIHYDNRLLQSEYGNEAWFDRAHNIYIDQLIDGGYIGLLAYIALYILVALTLISVSLKSVHKNDRIFAAILLIYFPLHFLELQTAFDTTISYFMFMIMIVCAGVLGQRMKTSEEKKEQFLVISGYRGILLVSGISIFFLWSFVWGLIPFMRAQSANGYVRTIGSSSERISKYPTLLGSNVDKHSLLWRMSTDFQKAIGSNPRILEDPQKVTMLRKEVEYFESEYASYIRGNPRHFRAYLNLADMLIYQRLFGVDKLNDAQDVLDQAIKLSPQAPQSYWMKSVAYLYMRKFDLAREYAKKGLELNPRIQQSKDLVQYIERSIKTFPEIDLYFFKQI